MRDHAETLIGDGSARSEAAGSSADAAAPSWAEPPGTRTAGGLPVSAAVPGLRSLHLALRHLVSGMVTWVGKNCGAR